MQVSILRCHRSSRSHAVSVGTRNSEISFAVVAPLALVSPATADTFSSAFQRFSSPSNPQPGNGIRNSRRTLARLTSDTINRLARMLIGSDQTISYNSPLSYWATRCTGGDTGIVGWVVGWKTPEHAPQPLSALPACGQINAKGPFPRIAVLNVDRRAPNRSNFLIVARAVRTGLECQDAHNRREHRASGVGEADAFDVAISSGPVLQRISLRCQIHTENIDERNILGRQVRNPFSIVHSPGFPDILFGRQHGRSAGISIGRLSIVPIWRLMPIDRFRGSRVWIDNRSLGVEGKLPLTVVANVDRCRPAVGRELLSATRAVNSRLIGDQLRVLTK